MDATIYYKLKSTQFYTQNTQFLSNRFMVKTENSRATVCKNIDKLKKIKQTQQTQNRIQKM